ncbi:MAG: hypothetical protein IJI47_06825 [Eubacterium sp.]|nr:hypothetical protein [Eubacterium sp.]
MKKVISLCLAAVMLVSVFSAGFTAEAAAPKKVQITSAVTTVDRFTKTAVLQLKWKAQKGVTGYQIKLSDGDYGGHYVWHTTRRVKGAKKTTFKIKDNYNIELYYWAARVRAYRTRNGRTVYGKWSNIRTTKVRIIRQVTGFKGQVVDQHHSALKLKMTWKAVKGAEGYQILYNQRTNGDDRRTITLKGGNRTSLTKWMGNVGYVQIRWYKTVNGKRKYSDYSDQGLNYYDYD